MVGSLGSEAAQCRAAGSDLPWDAKKPKGCWLQGVQNPRPPCWPGCPVLPALMSADWELPQTLASWFQMLDSGRHQLSHRAERSTIRWENDSVLTQNSFFCFSWMLTFSFHQRVSPQPGKLSGHEGQADTPVSRPLKAALSAETNPCTCWPGRSQISHSTESLGRAFSPPSWLTAPAAKAGKCRQRETNMERHSGCRGPVSLDPGRCVWIWVPGSWQLFPTQPPWGSCQNGRADLSVVRFPFIKTFSETWKAEQINIATPVSSYLVISHKRAV